jgi:F0F1-type ATP synthase assembly protein I
VAVVKFLGITALVVAGVLAFGGGPIVFVLLVMIGFPIAVVTLLASAGHASENPHFASKPKP